MAMPMRAWAVPHANMSDEARVCWRRIDRFKFSNNHLGTVIESYLKGYYRNLSEEDRSALLDYVIDFAGNAGMGQHFINELIGIFGERGILRSQVPELIVDERVGAMVNEAGRVEVLKVFPDAEQLSKKRQPGRGLRVNIENQRMGKSSKQLNFDVCEEACSQQSSGIVFGKSIQEALNDILLNTTLHLQPVQPVGSQVNIIENYADNNRISDDDTDMQEQEKWRDYEQEVDEDALEALAYEDVTIFMADENRYFDMHTGAFTEAALAVTKQMSRERVMKIAELLAVHCERYPLSHVAYDGPLLHWWYNVNTSPLAVHVRMQEIIQDLDELK